jgi:hypothetical protein
VILFLGLLALLRIIKLPQNSAKMLSLAGLNDLYTSLQPKLHLYL